MACLIGVVQLADIGAAIEAKMAQFFKLYKQLAQAYKTIQSTSLVRPHSQHGLTITPSSFLIKF